MLRDAVEGVGEIAWAGLNPAPQTPLNVEIGPHRRYAVVRQQLGEYKEVKNALGGTVNDVVLAVVSGALARWLDSRGVRTAGLEMRALVPVSVRTDDQRGTLGNQLAVMRAPLPVYIADPVARLRFVRKAMDGLKESKQAVGAATLAAFIGAGGLGEPIVAGLALADTRMILSGALPAAVLALAVDGLLGLVERLVAPAHRRGKIWRRRTDQPA